MKKNLVVCCLIVHVALANLAISNGQEGFGGAARLRAWEEHQRLAQESPFQELSWTRMGPKFAGGRIEAIDCPAGDLGTIYAGVGAGGIWKSINGGLTWQPIFEEQSTYSIGDISLAPSDPNVIWVGTGECHLSRSSYAGNGVYKSTDGGETWMNMGLHESAHIGEIAVDPIDSELVYVAAMGRIRGGGERGIFKTTNGGKTFRRVLYVNENVAFVDLIIDPFDRTRIFASAWDRGRGNESGVYRSNDSGETWERLTEGLLDKQVDRVAIDLSRSKQDVIYALMADRSNPALARRRNAALLFRSNDGGETWKQTHEGNVPTYVGWDFCDLRVAVDDSDHLYIGGLRLIESRDGGTTFQGEGGFAVNRDPAQVFRLHHHRGIGMHLDAHAIWLDPTHPERILFGNDGGLFSSLDRGQTWLHLNNLPIAEFYRIYLDDEEPFQVWGGTQDNASFVGPATAKYEAGVEDAWELVFLDPWSGGDGFSTFPDPFDSSVTYYTQQNGALQRSRRGQLKPTKSIRPREVEGKSLAFAWDTPFFASQHGSETVLYSAAQRVLKSTDQGDSWEAISPDFEAGPLLTLCESPVEAGRFIAGAADGTVYRKLDSGSEWLSDSIGLPNKRITDLEWSHHSPDTVYASFSGKLQADCLAYVYRSDDQGQTWTSIVNNLPAESVNVIEEDPANPGHLFVGTDLGVYVSIDHGETWQSLCSTLPTAPVVDLQVHGRDRVLVAATHGLGLFRMEIEAIGNSENSESKSD